MKENDLRDLIIKIQNKEIDIDDAILELKNQPYEDLGFAKVDHHRKLLQGQAEVIYGAGKSAKEIIKIGESLLERNSCVLITRLDKKKAKKVKKKLPLTYFKRSNIGYLGTLPPSDSEGYIVVATGGTSDIPVAEEAALTCEVYGNKVKRIYDVGISGLHRLLDKRKEFMQANCIIAIAGMEGALASVIGGLADCPVIAVPTSIGYGASFNGVAALLSMLNSCASGVSVVNIDNGFGAGYIASMINKQSRTVKN